MTVSSNIHRAFNARTLPHEELTDSFIVSDSYSKLISPSHSILVGPRGSGKTTLMRMMQVESLNYWCHPDADLYRESMKYSGVFVPTDRFWKTQFDNLRNSSSSVAGRNDQLLMSLFLYHVIERFCAVVEYRVNRAKKTQCRYRAIDIDASNEIELVNELSALWRVSPVMASLRSLESSISKKKNDISSYFNAFSSGGVVEEPDVSKSDIISLLDSSVRIVNSYFNEVGEKWVFLFDELELAPEEIVQPLVDSMRGGPEDIIFKLSLSPYHKDIVITTDSSSAMGGQDHHVVRLTGIDDKLGLMFSEQICASVFSRSGLTGSIRSYFEEPQKEMNVREEFGELAKKDPSFLYYLEKNGIDIERINEYTDKNKGPTIRKIKFVAQIRNYYFKQQRKKKRSPDLYVGFDNLCRSMEYNPRMLIGLMNILVSCVSGRKKIIKIHDQVTSLKRMFESHKSLLNTISVEDEGLKFSTVYEFIEKVGDKFREEILGEEFKAEPRGTLVFNKPENSRLEKVIGLALNAGALVQDNSGAETYYNNIDIKGSRCRLSFIFSHEFSLLLTKPRAIDLFSLFDVIDLVETESESAAVRLEDSRKNASKMKGSNDKKVGKGPGQQMELL